MDSVPLGDSIPESFALYLPSHFDPAENWPVIFVVDQKGRGSQALGMFFPAAEAEGYILAASNNTHDSLRVADNILIINRLEKRLLSVFPIQKERMYTAGQGTGGQIAALVPSFIKDLSGVISIGSDIPNLDLLNEREPFYYLGIVGTGDFNYTDMQRTRDLLNRKDFPNNLLVYEGEASWPDAGLLKMAVKLLTVQAMTSEEMDRDQAYLLQSFSEMMGQAHGLLASSQWLRAYDLLEEVRTIYSGLPGADSLDDQLKSIRRADLYRSQKREENQAFQKEALTRADYIYYLDEDIQTYNFDNLGWWRYQMEELEKYEAGSNQAEQSMGQRLKGYLNALIEDEISQMRTPEGTDEQALLLLYMLKTITAPDEFPYYLRIISLSSKYEDYGTALFYLEELLKQGYKDKEELYSQEHTALLRITPEYNALIRKYLDEPRYDLMEQ